MADLDALARALDAIGHLEADGHPYADEARRLLSLPPEHAAEIHALAVLADREPGSDATASELFRLEAKYGRDDPDLVRCRALIDFMTS